MNQKKNAYFHVIAKTLIPFLNPVSLTPKTSQIRCSNSSIDHNIDDWHPLPNKEFINKNIKDLITNLLKPSPELGT